MRGFYFLLFLAGLHATSSSAQLVDRKGQTIRPRYISFNISAPGVEDFRGEFLNVSYRDRIGDSETIMFSVHDSKGNLVNQLQLVKQFGQNYFDIKLQAHGISLLEGDSYVCRIRNENGEIFERTVRYASKVKIDISASIVVNPMQLSCNDPTGGNLVEFFGSIDGGKAPYKVNWYVLNDKRTDFLYQPANVDIPSPGQTSSIQVDKNPTYFVLLQVTDACGNEQIATVQVVCHKNEKKVNTLFFEKIEDVLLKKAELVK